MRRSLRRQFLRTEASKASRHHVGSVSIGPPGDGCGQNDSRQEVSRELVVSGCNSAEVLEPGEHALDDVTQAIGFAVVRDQWLCVVRWRG